MPEIVIIAAVSLNKCIGKDNTIPWHYKEDIAHFKELTTGYPCIMGKNTWISLPKKPLPNRLNIVLTSDTSFYEQGAVIKKTLVEALSECAAYEKVFICGGATLYKEALEIADRIELTEIPVSVEGDTFFPHFSAKNWVLEKKKNGETCTFLSYSKTRIKSS